jgi:tetratricopeptide (TPR) repeat protein
MPVAARPVRPKGSWKMRRAIGTADSEGLRLGLWTLGLAACLALAALASSGCGQSASAHRDEGITAFQVGDLDRAKMLLGESIERSPGDPRALYYMGRVMHREGFYEQAVYYYQSCLSVRPGHPTARRWLDMAMAELGPVGPKLEFLPPDAVAGGQPAETAQ